MTRLACRKSDHLAVIHSLDPKHVGPRKDSDQVKQRPGVLVKAETFEFTQSVQIEERGGKNLHSDEILSNKKVESGTTFHFLLFTFYVFTCLPVYVLTRSLLPQEIIQHTRELHREDIFRGRACADRLQRLEILKRHRLLINGLGGGEDLLERLRETFRA